MKLMLLFWPQNRTLNPDLTCSPHRKQLLMTLFLSIHVSTEPLLPCLQKNAFILYTIKPFPETPLTSALHFDVALSPVHDNMYHQPPSEETFYSIITFSVVTTWKAQLLALFPNTTHLFSTQISSSSSELLYSSECLNKTEARMFESCFV